MLQQDSSVGLQLGTRRGKSMQTDKNYIEGPVILLGMRFGPDIQVETIATGDKQFDTSHLEMISLT